MSISKPQIANYFQATLAVEVVPEIWQPARRFPHFLRAGYTFYQMHLLGRPCLLMADKEPARPAAVIRKHIAQVRAKWDDDILYAREKMTYDQRCRLIEEKIPFVVPGNQMYLPMLGIDLREHFRPVRQKATAFSPATQAVVLLLLTDAERRPYKVMELVDRLGYTKMTLSRSLNELRDHDIGIVQAEGRARHVAFDGPRRALWERVLPLLKSPVKQRYFVYGGVDAIATHEQDTDAGLTALAAYSILAAPRIPMTAVTTRQWKEIETRPGVARTTESDPNAVGVEVWSYGPRLFAKEGICDPFSLYLSLKDDQDERVQMALDEMMEAIQW